MTISSFFYFLTWCLISLILCGVGYIFVYFFQSRETANEFYISWIFYFNGILVGGFGYGLMWYIKKQGKNLLALVNNIVDISQLDSPKILIYARRASSFGWKNIIGIPLTISGAVIMWNIGFPLTGFAKYYLAICTTSIYYVASYILTFFIFSLLMFKAIEENLQYLRIRKTISSLDYEAINNFFAITATLGIFAIYIGFRGTLTANFTTVIIEESFNKLLVLPLIFFLPVTLVYSFYPRYILKKINDLEIASQIKNLEKLRENIFEEKATAKEQLEIENLISGIKEKLVTERKQMPLISYKDSPSLVIAILMIIQLIIQYDKTITDFFKMF